METKYITAEEIRDQLTVKPAVRELRRRMRKWPTAIMVRNRPLIPAREVDAFIAHAFAAKPRPRRPSLPLPKTALEEQQEVLAMLAKMKKARTQAIEDLKQGRRPRKVRLKPIGSD